MDGIVSFRGATHVGSIVLKSVHLVIKCVCIVVIAYKALLFKRAFPIGPSVLFNPFQLVNVFSLNRWVDAFRHLSHILLAMFAFFAYCTARNALSRDDKVFYLLRKTIVKLIPIVGQLSLILDFFSCISS